MHTIIFLIQQSRSLEAKKPRSSTNSPEPETPASHSQLRRECAVKPDVNPEVIGVMFMSYSVSEASG